MPSTATRNVPSPQPLACEALMAGIYGLRARDPATLRGPRLGRGTHAGSLTLLGGVTCSHRTTLTRAHSGLLERIPGIAGGERRDEGAPQSDLTLRHDDIAPEQLRELTRDGEPEAGAF